MTITIRTVFEEDGKLYPQVFLLSIKMSETIDLAYYQKKQNLILNKAKDFYKNNKERLKEHARNK